METDWNETHPQISDGLIRNTLSKATGNSYVTAERNKYRTRLEVAPNGGTYVFVSQKGMREALTGTNNDSSQWQAEAERSGARKRIPEAPDGGARAGRFASSSRPIGTTPICADWRRPRGGSGARSRRRRRQRRRTSRCPAQTAHPGTTRYPSSCVHGTHAAASRMTARGCVWASRSTAATSPSTTAIADRGIYFVRYVDPKDMTSAEQGFWSQVFHGKKEKVAKQYESTCAR